MAGPKRTEQEVLEVDFRAEHDETARRVTTAVTRLKHLQHSSSNRIVLFIVKILWLSM